ncbi:MAG: phosphonopyruvate decarboxylase [Rhodospirillales bacterium]|nr:phosphonopyruvate decarboxylase [Alphaproteobacteria bacterium]MBL6948849.1 phosphonopyruvate decarboxylase [Rhodospirillales bacterium]
MTTPDKNAWSQELFDLFVDAGVTLFPFIPDAGNARLIELATASNETRPVLLTSEEEGVAVCAGADLVGQRGVLCMQSSGVGNCPNFLSLVKGGDFPILMMVSMRGDFGEQNPWQYPMGQAVVPVLEAMGVLTFVVDRPEDLTKTTIAALSASGKGGQSAALILSQKFLGAKAF